MHTQVTLVFPERPDEFDRPTYCSEPKLCYLLHGASGNASDWVNYVNTAYYANKYNFIFVIPEVQLSMYSNMRYGLDYFDYAAKELPELMLNEFNLPKSRRNTFICGLSMGGYGAGKIGLSFPGHYSGIGIFSGLVDINNQLERCRRKEKMPPQFDERHWTGVFGDDFKSSKMDDLFFLGRKAAKLKQKPDLIQTCGTQDILFDMNNRFAASLDEDGYSNHLYLTWREAHTWQFWDRSLELALRFFRGEKVSSSDKGSYDMEK